MTKMEKGIRDMTNADLLNHLIERVQYHKMRPQGVQYKSRITEGRSPIQRSQTSVYRGGQSMNKIPVSFRCYYPTGEPCCKVQEIPLTDIPKWIDAYMFTHPACTAISVKVWAHDLESYT